MNDKKIVELLQHGRRDKAFVKLYKGFPTVKKLILSKGGTIQEAEDIFQEALIVFYRKASQPDFVLTSAISTYVYSVARYLWKDKQQKNNQLNTTKIEENQVIENVDELNEIIEKEMKIQVVEEVLKSIGEKCLKILHLFYYKGFSMKNIARQVDLRSERVAKNQKYKCLERARKKLANYQTTNI